jgi:hypothetical protein
MRRSPRRQGKGKVVRTSRAISIFAVSAAIPVTCWYVTARLIEDAVLAVILTCVAFATLISAIVEERH